MKSGLHAGQLILFMGWGLLLLGGQASASQDQAPLEIQPSLRFGGLDVPEAQMFDSPIDITIAGDGRIFILDSRDHNVKVFAPDGSYRKTFSREGAGPGELARPWIISAVGDEIYIADCGNQRVQMFSQEGQYLRSYKVPIRFGSGMTFDTLGRLHQNTQGFRSPHCMAVYDVSGALAKEFAELDGDSFEFFDFTEIRRAISKGEIPNSFRNDVLPAVAADGNIWMVYRSMPFFKIYSSEGQLLEKFSIESDTYRKIYRQFRDENKKLESRPNTYFPLRYVNDLVFDSRGNLHVLLNDSERMQILVYSRQGELQRTYLGPGEHIIRICFGPEERLFALSSETHFVYRFEL
jgi:hypothetical protein